MGRAQELAVPHSEAHKQFNKKAEITWKACCGRIKVVVYLHADLEAARQR